jgi:hypothetical protein
MVFAVGKHAFLVAVDRLQRRRACKEQLVTLLGGPGQMVRRGQHLRMIVLVLRHCRAEILDIASRNVTSRLPFGVMIASSNCLLKPSLLAIGPETLRRAQQRGTTSC